MRTFKRILGVLLIFLFGAFVGGAVTGAGMVQKLRETLLGGPEAVIDVVVRRLDHELKLDQEQKRKLQGIVDDARIQLRQSRAKIQPEVEQTLRDAEDKTRTILYPEQVKKFDEIVKRSREKWKTLEPAASPTAPAEPGIPAAAAPAPPPPSSTPSEATPVSTPRAPATPPLATPAPVRDDGSRE